MPRRIQITHFYHDGLIQNEWVDVKGDTFYPESGLGIPFNYKHVAKTKFSIHWLLLLGVGLGGVMLFALAFELWLLGYGIASEFFAIFGAISIITELILLLLPRVIVRSTLVYIDGWPEPLYFEKLFPAKIDFTQDEKTALGSWVKEQGDGKPEWFKEKLGEIEKLRVFPTVQTLKLWNDKYLEDTEGKVKSPYRSAIIILSFIGILTIIGLQLYFMHKVGVV